MPRPKLQDVLLLAMSKTKDVLYQVRATVRPNSVGSVQSPDRAFRVVHPSNFARLIEPTRYGTRSASFDAVIKATHGHFWDPLDKRYLNFDEPFDVEHEFLGRPEAFAFELKIPKIAARLTHAQKVRLTNDSVHWFLSQILHGEQGGLTMSATLCQLLEDPGAQEFAANQAREEARHVVAFARYIRARWGEPLPCGVTLARVIDSLVQTNELYQKIVGMQMLIEGIAMGTFTYFHENTADPLLKRMLKFVMADEAGHHKFSKLWASNTVHKLTPAERTTVERWAAATFVDLILNLVTATQKRMIYANVGLDWRWVQKTLLEELDGYEMLRDEMKENNNVFRVLVKTLLQAGLITPYTEGIYRTWLDLDELRKEDSSMAGDGIAADGVRELEEINARRRQRNAVAAEG
jgi:hypothetical protein